MARMGMMPWIRILTDVEVVNSRNSELFGLEATLVRDGHANRGFALRNKTCRTFEWI